MVQVDAAHPHRDQRVDEDVDALPLRDSACKARSNVLSGRVYLTGIYLAGIDIGQQLTIGDSLPDLE